MSIGIAPKLDSLNLSRSQNFIQNIKLQKEYPSGTTAQIIIKDDADITLATWNGTVKNRQATFNETDIPAIDKIPHGAKFDLMLTIPDGRVIKWAYGRVVRAENRYPLVASAVTTNYALQFSDNFDRTSPGKYWVPRSSGNAIEIHTNGGRPSTLGPNNSLFKDAGCLWYAPLNSNSFTISVSMENLGAGKCSIVTCSDYSMKSWLGVRFETGVFNNTISIVRGTGPTTWEIVPGFNAPDHNLNDGDNFTIKYNDLTRQIYCFKGTNLSSALVGWTDTNKLIPTGLGYRYVGFAWQTSLFAPGAEPSAWSVKDGV